MQDHVVKKLLRLNNEFYQTFALPFSDTRARVQPGVLRAIENTPINARILDLGCGNGSLERALSAHGHQGAYLGMDSCPDLLEIANQKSNHPAARFVLGDLSDPTWSSAFEGQFDRIYAFSVLHHLPGVSIRLRAVRQMAALLSPQARIVLSTWNFLASKRLRDRILPWSTINLAAGDIDPGDYLLDWRRGGHGLRYVHYFTAEELSALAESANLKAIESYYADGQDGKLGQYQIWASPGEP